MQKNLNVTVLACIAISDSNACKYCNLFLLLRFKFVKSWQTDRQMPLSLDFAAKNACGSGEGWGRALVGDQVGAKFGIAQQVVRIEGCYVDERSPALSQATYKIRLPVVKVRIVRDNDSNCCCIQCLLQHGLRFGCIQDRGCMHLYVGMT